MSNYTTEQLLNKKKELVEKKSQEAELKGKLTALGDGIKKDFKVESLKELVALEVSTKAELVSIESTYSEKCESFREKFDV